jgi:hypothetical protein
VLRGRNQTFEIVAHHALENYFNPQLIDLLGEIKRIRIHAEGRQQFGANRNDFSVHG